MARLHLVRAVLYTAAYLALYLIAVRTTAGQVVDAATLGGFETLRATWWLEVYGLRSELVVLLVFCAGASVLIALLRRRFADAAVATSLAVSVVALLLVSEHVLARPYLGDQGYVENTFPSGHLALALASAVVVLRLWGGALGVWAFILLTGASVLVGWTLLLSFAHRGSDMIGAALLVGAVTQVASAIRVQQHPPDTVRAVGALVRRSAPFVALACVVLVLLWSALPAQSSVGAELLVLAYILVLVALVLLVLAEAPSRPKAGTPPAVEASAV